MKRFLIALLFGLSSLTGFAQPDCYQGNAKLIVQPGAGTRPILQAIRSARHHIRLTIYTLNNRSIISALINAQHRGVDTQVILENNPYKMAGFNRPAFGRLKKAKVDIQSGDPRHQYTHQKTLIIDQHEAFLMTGNFTPSGIFYQRNFYFVSQHSALISQLIALFQADWSHKPVTLFYKPLVLSPDNSEKRLVRFIDGAKHRLFIYASGIDDYKIIDAIKRKARHGVTVKIRVNSSTVKNNKRWIKKLKRAGVSVYVNNKLVIHAKVLIRDPGTENREAYLGSANLTYVSLTKNREAGIMICNQAIVDRLTKTFYRDIGRS